MISACSCANLAILIPSPSRAIYQRIRTSARSRTQVARVPIIDSIRLKTPVGVDDTQQRPKMDGRKEKTRQRPATQTEAPLTKRRSGDWPSTSVALPGTDIQRRLLACTLVHGTVGHLLGRGKMEGVKTVPILDSLDSQSTQKIPMKKFRGGQAAGV